jgi:hypothetical protein
MPLPDACGEKRRTSQAAIAAPAAQAMLTTKKAGESFRMRPDDEGVAKSVCPFKQEQEERSYEA